MKSLAQHPWLLLSFLALLFTFPQTGSAASYPDGSLLKALDSSRVYVLEHGEKRWIQTESIFFAHGFSWNELRTVSPHELDVYPEGASVSETGSLDLPQKNDILPDLIPLAMQDLHIGTEAGRKVLRFTSLFWNQGPGDLVLMTSPADPSSDGSATAIQSIRQQSGDIREQEAGSITFHSSHDHYHLDNFSEYRLEPIRVFASAPTQAARREKVSFCIRDDVLIDGTLEDSPSSSQFFICNNRRQGISVGWADKYHYSLADQFIPIEGLPPGIYRLVFDVNPGGFLFENTLTNNSSAVLVELDPEKNIVNTLGSAAPFHSSLHTFTDGVLIKGDKSSRVYVMHGNKKRWLRNEQTFLSYGLSLDNVYELPEAAVDSIPTEQFVRTENGAVFMLNAHGYVRRILNPVVLGSYQTGNIPLVNNVEMESYQPAEFIQRDGSLRVYSVHSKTLIGFESQLSEFNIERLSVHRVNETDFKSYVVATSAQDLTIPWDVAFLPDGDMLVTERPGTLRRYGSSPATFSIPDVLHAGEGGLMGIAVHPNFAQNQFIYLYFTTREDSTKNRVARYRLLGNVLNPDKIILDNIPGSSFHDGGQIAFGPDGMLYLTTGDAGNANSAQNIQSLAGKILRLTSDGDIPGDNPFGNAVWSYGHRNGQGLAWDNSGNLWGTEHGRSGAQSGFDELNVISIGANYGWPVIQGNAVQGDMRAPRLHSGAFDTWAPSGLAYKDNVLYFSGLRGSRLYAAGLGGNAVVSVDEYFTNEFGRLRAATIGPDNMLYLTTSNRDGRGSVRSGDDKVIKIAPEMLSGLVH